MRAAGIDIGYGNVKVVTDSCWGSFPSLVGNFEEGINIPDFGGRPLEAVDLGEEKFLIGESARKHSTRLYSSRDRGWIGGKAYKALVKFAIQKCGLRAGEMAAITTGLPAAYFKADKDLLAALITDVAEEVGITARVSILPQPMGAFFSQFFDEKGHVLDERLAAGRVGVLDVGYYTTDLVTLDHLDIVDKQLGSIESGVSTALEAIKRDLYDAWQVNLDLHRTEEAVRKGKVTVFGEELDISGIRDQRLKELAGEIESHARTIWGNGADLGRVLLAGGGAALLSGHLDIYRHAKIVRDPAFAIASGFFRHAIRKCV